MDVQYGPGKRWKRGDGGGTPGLSVDVVEEEELEAEACVCSARTEALHRSLSTTTLLCFQPRHQNFREEKGEIGEEKTAAAEREEEGEARVRARLRGGFMEGRSRWPRGPPGGGAPPRFRRSVTVGTKGYAGWAAVGCAAVGGRWAVTACLPTAVWFYFFFFLFF